MRLYNVLTAAVLAASFGFAAPVFAQSTPFVTVAINDNPVPRTIERDSVTAATGEFLGWVVSKTERPGRANTYIIEVATPLSPDRPRNVTLTDADFFTIGERYQVKYDFGSFVHVMREQNHG